MFFPAISRCFQPFQASDPSPAIQAHGDAHSSKRASPSPKEPHKLSTESAILLLPERGFGKSGTPSELDRKIHSFNNRLSCFKHWAKWKCRNLNPDSNYSRQLHFFAETCLQYSHVKFTCVYMSIYAHIHMNMYVHIIPYIIIGPCQLWQVHFTVLLPACLDT